MTPLRRAVPPPLRLLLRGLFGAALLALVLRSVDLHALVHDLRSFRPGIAAVLVAVGLGERALMGLKWNLLLRARGIRISMPQAVRLYFVGHLMGFLTPGAIGAEAYRVTALSALRRNWIVVSTIVLERAIGLAVIASLALLTLPFSMPYLIGSRAGIQKIVILGALLIVPAVILSLQPRIIRSIVRRVPFLTEGPVARLGRKFYEAYSESRLSPSTLIWFTALTVVDVLLLIWVNTLAAWALDIRISFFYFVCVMPILHIALRLPVTFLGIGVLEGLMAFFLISAGYTAADGVAISLFLRVVELITVIPLGVLLAVARPLRIEAPAESKQP
jgi:uncharacterized protein (TIRG00374 family)